MRQPLRHCLLQALPQHRVQSANRLVAETQIVHVFVPLHSAVRLRLIVKFLDLQCRERRQFDVPPMRGTICWSM